MRVALPHFGQSVDFDVSITFLRSAVFAIFAISKSPFGAVRLKLLWRGMGNQERRPSRRPSARKPPRKLFATGTRTTHPHRTTRLVSRLVGVLCCLLSRSRLGGGV